VLPENPTSSKTAPCASIDPADRTNRKELATVLFYATDYPEAGRAIAKLITTSGFAPVNVGGVDQSVRIEAFGELSEYGKLGRLVTSKEAEVLINRAPRLQLKSA
jgi:predicted dinucleotide-binding enzyme